MQFQTIQNSVGEHGNKHQTPFSILANKYESGRTATTDVTEQSGASTPFTPWYAKVKPQTLILDDAVRKEMGMINNPVFQPVVADNAESWKELSIFGLTTGILNESDVLDLMESTPGSMEQVKAAQQLGKRILNTYRDRVISQEKVVKDHLKGLGLENAIKPDYQEWYKDQSEGTWGFEITLDDGDIYGGGESQLQEDFSGLGIRIESATRVTALNFNLDRFSVELAKLYYAVITRLSQGLAQKMTTFDLTIGTDIADMAQSFTDYKLSKWDAQELADMDGDDIETELERISPEWHKALSEYEYYEVKDAANYALMTTFNPWHTDTQPYKDDSSESFYNNILADLHKLKKDSDNAIETNGIKALEVVIQTVLKLAKFDDANLTPWRCGSDTHISNYAYTSFSFDAENYSLEFENEHRQSVGEYGALRLDLKCGDSGFDMVDNILLGDYCLMALATVATL